MWIHFGRLWRVTSASSRYTERDLARCGSIFFQYISVAITMQRGDLIARWHVVMHAEQKEHKPLAICSHHLHGKTNYIEILEWREHHRMLGFEVHWASCDLEFKDWDDKLNVVNGGSESFTQVHMSFTCVAWGKKTDITAMHADRAAGMHRSEGRLSVRSEGRLSVRSDGGLSRTGEQR